MRSTHSFNRLVLTAAGLGLIATACADPTAPAAGSDLEASAVVVGSLPTPPGALGPMVVSNGSTKYCGVITSNMGGFPVGLVTTSASFPGPASACGTNATDLTGPLAAYNPGWGAPVGGSNWIGVTVAGPTDYGAVNVPSNYYAALPGARSFKVDFNVAAGVTPRLQLEVRADNDVLVYLNDQLIGRHAAIPDDNAQNWLNSLYIDERRVDNNASAFVVGTNTLRFDLIGTRILNVGGQAAPCVPNTVGGPPGSEQVAPGVTVGSNTALYNQTDCRNPTGLSFKGQVFLESLGNQGCSHGFWKNKALKTPNQWTAAGYAADGSTTLSGAGFVVPNQGGPTGAVTMLAALNYGGGPGVVGAQQILLRNAVAALLNSKVVAYPLTSAQVLAQVNAALATNNRNTMLALEAQLDIYNNLHNASICPD